MDKDCNGRTLSIGDIVEPIELCYMGMHYRIVGFRDKELRIKNIRSGGWGYKHVACRVRKLEIEELI